MIFVFGSNLAGRHGKGAAEYALAHRGAIYGQGQGRQGESYAIPTKSRDLIPLSLREIETHIQTFADYAKSQPHELFLLTPVGAGLTGYTKREIAYLLKRVELPHNVVLHTAWIGGVNERSSYEKQKI